MTALTNILSDFQRLLWISSNNYIISNPDSSMHYYDLTLLETTHRVSVYDGLCTVLKLQMYYDKRTSLF